MFSSAILMTMQYVTKKHRSTNVFEVLLSSTRSPLIRVLKTHCLYSNFHVDDLKTEVQVLD